MRTSLDPWSTPTLTHRRSVRVTYHRDADEFSAAIYCGDERDESYVWWRGPEEDFAEMWAEFFASVYGLDITRLDVD